MKYQILVLLGLSVIAAPAVVRAQTETLDYTGSEFTSLSIDGSVANGIQNSLTENTGQFVLSAPLGEILNNVALTPLSWSFDSSTTEGNFYLNSGPQSHDGAALFSALFSTNANGAIIGWSIAISNDDFGATNSPAYAGLTITNSGDTYAAGEAGVGCSAQYPGSPSTCFQISESNSAAGSWASTIEAPELDSDSAGAAVTLLLGCLIVASGRRNLRGTVADQRADR